MADLLIGCPDETTAETAAVEVSRLPLSKYGDTVLKSSLPTDVERKLQEALHGAEQPTLAATGRAPMWPLPHCGSMR